MPIATIMSLVPRESSTRIRSLESLAEAVFSKFGVIGVLQNTVSFIYHTWNLDLVEIRDVCTPGRPGKTRVIARIVCAIEHVMLSDGCATAVHRPCPFRVFVDGLLMFCC
jgi:hypothetical protein